MKKIQKKMTVLLMTALLTVCFASGAAAEGLMYSMDIDRSISVRAGDSVTLSVSAEGASSWNWYRDSESNPVPGANSADYYFVAGESENGACFFCIYTLDGETVTSGRCQVQVEQPEQPEAITQDLPSAVSVLRGETLTLTAAASGSGLSCQWYTDSGVLDGQTGSSLSIRAEDTLNGQRIRCQFYKEGVNMYTSWCTVTVLNPAATPTPSPAPETPTPSPEPTPAVAPPVITKNPTGETVKEGERAIFIARADGVKEYIWRITSKDNTKTYTYKDIRSVFPQLSVSGGDTDTLTLSNIPYAMSGWKIACLFKNEGGEIVSTDAILQVQRPDSTLSILSQPKGETLALDENMDYVLTVHATASNGGTFKYQWYCAEQPNLSDLKAITGAVNGSYKPTRAEGTFHYVVEVSLYQSGTKVDTLMSDVATVTFTPKTAHEHSFSSAWDFNNLSHWHQCTCGDHADESFHSYEWTVLTEPTKTSDGQQQGVCSVCGFETLQPIPAGSVAEPADNETAEKDSHTALYIALIAAALCVIAGAVFLIRRVLRSTEN